MKSWSTHLLQKSRPQQSRRVRRQHNKRWHQTMMRLMNLNQKRWVLYHQVMNVWEFAICIVATMTNLMIRNTTLSCSRSYRYEALSLHGSGSGRDKIFKSLSYRRRRAKQRKIFLTTYKLSSNIDTFAEPKSPKLTKVALKLKKIAASVLKFMQTAGSFRSKSSILWRFWNLLLCCVFRMSHASPFNLLFNQFLYFTVLLQRPIKAISFASFCMDDNGQWEIDTIYYTIYHLLC